MNVIEWLKGIVVIEEEEPDYPDEEEPVIQKPEASSKQKTIRVFEPEACQDALKIADAVLSGDDSVINLKHLDETSRQRLTDFLCGVTYQRSCEIRFTGKEILLCRWEENGGMK